MEHDGVEWWNEENAHGNYYVIHDNTIYNVENRGIRLLQCGYGHGGICFNNIIFDVPYELLSGPQKDTVSGYIKESDHNLFGSPLYIATYNSSTGG